MTERICPTCGKALTNPSGGSAKDYCPRCRTPPAVPPACLVCRQDQEAIDADEENRLPRLRVCASCRASLNPHGRPGPFLVQVPGVATCWPPWCPCCGGAADAWLTVSCVGSSDDPLPTWDVPYCSRCLKHIALHTTTNTPLETAQNAYDRLVRKVAAVEKGPLPGRVDRLIRVSVVGTLVTTVLGLLSFAGCTLSVFLIFMPMGRRGRFDGNTLFYVWLTAVILSVLLTLGAGIGISWLYWRSARKTGRKQQAAELADVRRRLAAAWGQLEQARQTGDAARERLDPVLQSACPGPAVAVFHAARLGEVHTFGFASDAYAAAFLAANRTPAS